MSAAPRPGPEASAAAQAESTAAPDTPTRPQSRGPLARLKQSFSLFSPSKNTTSAASTTATHNNNNSSSSASRPTGQAIAPSSKKAKVPFWKAKLGRRKDNKSAASKGMSKFFRPGAIVKRNTNPQRSATQDSKVTANSSSSSSSTNNNHTIAQGGQPEASLISGESDRNTARVLDMDEADGDLNHSGLYTTPKEEKHGRQTQATEEQTPVRKTKTKQELALERRRKKNAKLALMLQESAMDMDSLRTLAWAGLPPQTRAPSWKLLLGYLPANQLRREQTMSRRRQEYASYCTEFFDATDKSESELSILRQISIDVPRTCQKLTLFRNKRIQTVLTRILYIWSHRHTASGYVQGINDLATPFLVVFVLDAIGAHLSAQAVTEVLEESLPTVPTDVSKCISAFVVTDKKENLGMIELIQAVDPDTIDDATLQCIEADTFSCLTQLLNGIQDHYIHAQPGIQKRVFKLSELIRHIDANLYKHLQKENVPFMHFAYRWMNCLLMRELSLPLVIRVWDTYLAEESADGFKEFHVYVCAAFLMRYTQELQQKEFQDLVLFLQHLPTEEWTAQDVESLLSQAYVYKSLYQNAHFNQA